MYNDNQNGNIENLVNSFHSCLVNFDIALEEIKQRLHVMERENDAKINSKIEEVQWRFENDLNSINILFLNNIEELRDKIMLLEDHITYLVIKKNEDYISTDTSIIGENEHNNTLQDQIKLLSDSLDENVTSFNDKIEELKEDINRLEDETSRNIVELQNRIDSGLIHVDWNLIRNKPFLFKPESHQHDVAISRNTINFNHHHDVTLDGAKVLTSQQMPTPTTVPFVTNVVIKPNS